MLSLCHEHMSGLTAACRESTAGWPRLSQLWIAGWVPGLRPLGNIIAAWRRNLGISCQIEGVLRRNEESVCMPTKSFRGDSTKRLLTYFLLAGRRGLVHGIQVQAFRAADCGLSHCFSHVAARAVQPLPAESTAHPVSRACLPLATAALLVAITHLHCSASFSVPTVLAETATVPVAGIHQQGPAAWVTARSLHV